ncbi:hypothetical protein SMICM17S_04475 [Streptomyces microflavus]
MFEKDLTLAQLPAPPPAALATGPVPLSTALRPITETLTERPAHPAVAVYIVHFTQARRSSGRSRA